MGHRDTINLVLALGVTIWGNICIFKSCKESSEEQERISKECQEMINGYSSSSSNIIDGPKFYEPESRNKLYRYRVTISDDPSNWDEYEVEPSGQGRVKLRRQSNGYEYLNGTWEWECEEYLPTLQDQYNYIKEHHRELRSKY